MKNSFFPDFFLSRFSAIPESSTGRFFQKQEHLLLSSVIPENFLGIFPDSVASFTPECPSI